MLKVIYIVLHALKCKKKMHLIFLSEIATCDALEMTHKDEVETATACLIVTGHSPQDDRPELVAAALRPWLLDL
jgi:hypothetical protein